MIHVAALIINWNGATDTLDLIESLIGEVDPGLLIEVILIDNASQPDDLAKLQDGIEKMRERIPILLIANDNNVGVPAAYNQCIAAVQNRDSLFLRLDNDVVFLKGGVRALCDGLKNAKNAGVRIVGGNVKYFDEPKTDNGGAYSFNLMQGKNRVTYPSQDTQCDGVLGCVMLIDPGVVHAFEPEVFLSWLFFTTDESELSLHSRRFGWSTLYIAQPVALHKGGRSTRKIADRASYLSVRNWSYLALRYAQPRIAALLIFGRIVATSIYKVLCGNFAAAEAMLVGILAATRDQRKVHKKGKGT